VSAAEILATVEAGLVEHFAQVPVRASVTFLGVEQIDVLRFEPIPGELMYVSLGMSRHPMADPSTTVVSGEGPRAELALHVHETPDRFTDIWSNLAVLAAAPAVEGVVYMTGMTVDLGQPIAFGSRCTGVVVSQPTVGSIAAEGHEVAILQLLPATPNELAWARVRGVSALEERWRELGVDLLDLGRTSVALE
jgi:Suppressor of fused protein (SUFU)